MVNFCQQGRLTNTVGMMRCNIYKPCPLKDRRIHKGLFFRDGGFAEYCLVPAAQCFHIQVADINMLIKLLDFLYIYI